MADLRRLVRQGLETGGVPDEHSERLILVIDEVVSNSIEHGTEYRKSSDPIRVSVTRVPTGWRVIVDDVDVPSHLVQGLAQVFGDHPGTAPSALEERGRGMFLITMFLTDLVIASADGGGMRLQGVLAG